MSWVQVAQFNFYTFVILSSLVIYSVLSYDVVSIPVTFPSLDTPSGKIILSGSLTMPIGLENNVGAVVLVAGSGPSNRYETYSISPWNFYADPPIEPQCGTTPISGAPFAELALAIAQTGMIALTYDKRSCQPTADYPCANWPCGGIIQQNCVNNSLMILNDYISDAEAAVKFVTTQKYVNPQSIYLMGHSQGTNIIPYVANSINSNYWANNITVAGILLLMGGGRSIDLVIERQFMNNTQYAQKALTLCTGTGLEDQLLYATAENIIQTNQQELNRSQYWFPKIKSGELPSDQIVCTDGCETVAFWSSWLNITDTNEVEKQLTKFVLEYRGSIYALNSPTDFNSAPADYEPLHQILYRLQKETNSSVEVDIIDNITHELGPMSFQSGLIEQQVFLSILKWFSNFQNNNLLF